jgi:cell division protein ZapD
VTGEKIIFEQPLNEHIRICLRLEYLFSAANSFIIQDSQWGSRMALSSILEILSVIDRPDLKSRLGQALNQYVNYLLLLEKQPGVDKEKLNHTLQELEGMIDFLHTNQGKIGHELRDNEFLFTIQQRLYTPAGTCAFCVPAYHSWLEMPIDVRKKQLTEWIRPFNQIKSMIDLLLKITRESATLHKVVAEAGFYQMSLDPAIPYQMIRIELPASLCLYPEISSGKHRLTVHFFEVNVHGRSTQTKQNVQFELACCKI